HSDQHDVSPPDPVRKVSKINEQRCSDEERDSNDRPRLNLIYMKDTFDEIHGVELASVPDNTLPGSSAEQCYQYELQILLFTKTLFERVLRQFSFRLYFGKQRRLRHFESYVDRYSNEQR